MLQPVNRLPLELLSQIVRCVPREHDIDARSIVPLTHVCRYWREAIISTPEHWTALSGWSRGIAAVSLERVKPPPLEIIISLTRGGRWFSDLLTPRIQNTKTLNVNYLPVTELKNSFPNFPQSTPNLRSLTLVAQQVPGWGQCMDPFPPYSEISQVCLHPSLLVSAQDQNSHGVCVT
jgi:hypothetical protein